MLLSSLLLIPIIGVLAILVFKDNGASLISIKFIALTTSILNLFVSLIIFILFDFSTNQFQFVQEYHEISNFDFFLGVDGLSIYFVLLTTIIMPISLLSNWTSISTDVGSYVIILLLLETFLLTVFLVLDILLFYIFFESILPPLFILIGMFGSDNRVKASFYLFLYTLLGSLFLLLSILAMSSIMSTTDFDALFKGNFVYLTQLFLFYGIFIAFAVKTPTMFLNTWLLKAHVESPLGGSIILAAIVLKLSLYGIFRLILPVLPKGYMEYTYIIYVIGVITIIYASLSTLRTIDVKELIAYSSVSHAAVYLLGVFSNSIQGIEGGISLGLAHGLVSPGLFICAGGILYDRCHTRVIAIYRGTAQIMPLFAILFFILCLANCGAPLSLNFIGEFLSLYGVFERSSLFGLFASSSIVFSAAYTMYMYQKISFGGSYSRMFTINIPDLNKREFMILLTLVVPTVIFGIYPAPILDAIHYSVSTLIYSVDLPDLVYNFMPAFILRTPSSSNNPTANNPEFLSTGVFTMDGYPSFSWEMNPLVKERLETLKGLTRVFPQGSEERRTAVEKVNYIISSEQHLQRSTFNRMQDNRVETLDQTINAVRANPSILTIRYPSVMVGRSTSDLLPVVAPFSISRFILPIIQPFLFLFTLSFFFIINLNLFDDFVIPYINVTLEDLVTILLIIQYLNLLRKFYNFNVTIKNLIKKGNYEDIIIIAYISVLSVLIFICFISNNTYIQYII